MNNIIRSSYCSSSWMHLSRAIVPAVIIDTNHSGTQISFSAEVRKAQSSGGFTLKEGGAK